MWVKLDSDDNIVAEYARATALLVDDVQYPATIFKNADKLRSFGIVPLRRVQLNAPEDTVGWTSSFEFVVVVAGGGFEADHVRKEVTWTELPDAAQRRADRDAMLVRKAWDQKRARLDDFLYSKGYMSETLLTPADLVEFDVWYAAQLLAETP